MSTISHVVPATLLVVAVLVLCLTDGKHWPDFSCYPANESERQKAYVSHDEMGWKSCRYTFDTYKVKCDKVCVLGNREILIRTVKNGPYTINIDTFMTIFAEELGINMDGSADAQQQKLMDKVRSALEDCKRNHPEYATLPVKKTQCEPWSNITQCIDNAVGCKSD